MEVLEQLEIHLGKCVRRAVVVHDAHAAVDALALCVEACANGVITPLLPVVGTRLPRRAARAQLQGLLELQRHGDGVGSGTFIICPVLCHDAPGKERQGKQQRNRPDCPAHDDLVRVSPGA
jgi:hypothetical protein